MADIFISYAREDRPWVEKLAKALVAEGYSVWWDWDLLVGKRYRESIETELQSAKCAIVVWSESSVHSDFVRDEAEEGLQRNILVPVLKESVRPPAGFRQLQTAELSTWSGTDMEHAEFRRMMKGVSHMIGREPGTAAPAAEAAPVVAPAPAAPAAPVMAKMPEPAIRTVPPPPPPAAPQAAVSVSRPMGLYIAGGAVAVLVLIGAAVAVIATSHSSTPPAPAAAGAPATGQIPTATAPVQTTPTPTTTPPPPASDAAGDGPANANGDVAGNAHGARPHPTPPAAPAAPAAPADDGATGGDEGQGHGR